MSSVHYKHNNQKLKIHIIGNGVPSPLPCLVIPLITDHWNLPQKLEPMQQTLHVLTLGLNKKNEKGMKQHVAQLLD